MPLSHFRLKVRVKSEISIDHTQAHLFLLIVRLCSRQTTSGNAWFLTHQENTVFKSSLNFLQIFPVPLLLSRISPIDLYFYLDD